MGGYTGSAVGEHTRRARLSGTTFAISIAQWRLLLEAQENGGSIHVTGRQVVTARGLSRLYLGTLTDDGALGPSRTSNVDGERWTFSAADGVEMRPIPDSRSRAMAKARSWSG